MRCGCASLRTAVANDESGRTRERLAVLRELADAFALQQAGRLDDAEAAYAKVLAKMPDDPVALINAGALALTRDDLPMALARLTRAVQHVPANAIARNNLGFAQLRSGIWPLRIPGRQLDGFALGLTLGSYCRMQLQGLRDKRVVLHLRGGLISG